MKSFIKNLNLEAKKFESAKEKKALYDLTNSLFNQKQILTDFKEKRISF